MTRGDGRLWMVAGALATWLAAGSPAAAHDGPGAHDEGREAANPQRRIGGMIGVACYAMDGRDSTGADHKVAPPNASATASGSGS